ncbi:MAG: molecular chaperone HtpG, partial [Bdellovibrionales bacterium]|nr:molecular chaperone HtpG [Bdellovibrionales bacterium]
MNDKKTESFTTEVSELLQLIIHSLYSHPEIFLRELISNASDALDKLKLESLTDGSLTPAGYEGFIRLVPDKEARTLKVVDNGIGMTIEEVRENLGTIAHSGTRQFLARKQELQEDPDLIGQFGVGFYSAFIVADKVIVETQKAGSSEGVRWESDGKGSFDIEPCTRTEGLGTTITLFLKEAGEEEGDLADFSDEWTLRSIVKKHSDFIAYPIKMETRRTKTNEDGSEGETEIEDQILNSQKAIWLTNPSEVTGADYNEFYRTLTFDSADPLEKIHYKAEGTIEFSALLYFPASKPWNYDYEDSNKGLQLYVKRVLIMSDCEDILPLYLRFVRGVVDSSDLSLNVSREILQHNRQIIQIRKAVTNRVLKALEEMKSSAFANYIKLWELFGSTLKEGIIREPERKEKLLPLYLFKTNRDSSWQSLDDYVERMKEGQPAIYYVVGDDPEQLALSPHLERLKEKDYEVIFLSDRI